jgi:hypothetical protein
MVQSSRCSIVSAVAAGRQLSRRTGSPPAGHKSNSPQPQRGDNDGLRPTASEDDRSYCPAASHSSVNDDARFRLMAF